MNSLEYWRKREDENTRLYQKDEKQVEKEIAEIYQNTLDNVEKEINSFYAKYAAKEGITIQEAKKRVTKADIEEYEKKAEKYVKLASQDRANGTDANAHIYFSNKANEEMALYNLTMKVNRLEMLKSKIGLELAKGNAEAEAKMQKQLEKRSLEEMKRQAGILGESINNQLKKANSIVTGSFHNATFSDRIWANMDMLKAKIDTLLQQGMIQGKGARQLASNIRKEFNVTTFQAERLMRTELARIQIETQKESYIRNGFEEYEFIANSGCCDACQALNGKIFKVKKMMPGENAAPIHPNCRCSLAPYEDSQDYEAWLSHLENGGTTESWQSFKKSGGAKRNFKDAKTIEEAENYIKKFVDDSQFGAVGVSYKGIGIDSANAVNKALTKLFDEYDIGKLGGVYAPRGNTKLGKLISNAKAAYSPLRKSLLLNTKTFKNTKTLLKEIQQEKHLTTEYLKNPKAFTVSSKTAENVLKASKMSGRSTVPDNIEDIINHEFGHAFEKAISQMDSYDKVKSNMPKYAEKISGYATHNFSEYIAESFASYRKGESVIDPELKNIFEQLKTKNVKDVKMSSEKQQLKIYNSKDIKTIVLPKQEYAHVMSELNTNLSKAQRKEKIVSKAIGDYVYIVENNGFSDYRIIGKYPIDGDDYE